MRSLSAPGGGGVHPGGGCGQPCGDVTGDRWRGALPRIPAWLRGREPEGGLGAS